MENIDVNKLSIVVDLGSYEIKGVVGYVNEAGNFVCLTSEVEESSGISHGNVKNPTEAAGHVKVLMKKLYNRLDNLLKKVDVIPENHRIEIEKIYVTMSGAYTQGAFKRIERNLGRAEVTEDILKDIIEENDRFAQLAYAKYEKDFLMAIPQRYILDGFLEKKPVGCICNHLVVDFQNILIRKDLIKNMESCFDRAGFANVEFRLSPLSMANTILTQQEREEGAVLIDFGDQDTSVSLFHENLLKYIYVIPKGSDHITKDLRELNLPEEAARNIKRKCSAMPGLVAPGTYFTETIYGEDRVFECEVLASIVEARLNKILGQVQEVISYVPCGNSVRQIVMVGGGARLKNIKEKTEEALGIPVRLGTMMDMEDRPSIRSFAAALATLYNAKGESISIQEIKIEAEKEKKPRKLGIVTGFKKKVDLFVSNMFEDQTENSNDQM